MKRVPQSFNKYTWGGVSLLAGATVAELRKPTGDIIETCYDKSKDARGAICAGYAFGQLVVTAAVGLGTYFSHDVLILLKLIEGAAAKRDQQGTHGPASGWAGMRPADQDTWRQHFAMDGFHVHDIAPSTSGIRDAVTVRYSRDKTSDPFL